MKKQGVQNLGKVIILKLEEGEKVKKVFLFSGSNHRKEEMFWMEVPGQGLIVLPVPDIEFQQYYEIEYINKYGTLRTKVVEPEKGLPIYSKDGISYTVRDK